MGRGWSRRCGRILDRKWLVGKAMALVVVDVVEWYRRCQAVSPYWKAKVAGILLGRS